MNTLLLTLFFLFLLFRSEGVYLLPGVLLSLLLLITGVALTPYHIVGIILVMSVVPLASWFLGGVLDRHSSDNELFARYLPLIVLGLLAHEIFSGDNLSRIAQAILHSEGSELGILVIESLTRGFTWVSFVALGLTLVASFFEFTFVTFLPRKKIETKYSGALRFTVILLLLSISSSIILEGAKSVL